MRPRQIDISLRDEDAKQDGVEVEKDDSIRGWGKGHKIAPGLLETKKIIGMVTIRNASIQRAECSLAVVCAIVWSPRTDSAGKWCVMMMAMVKRVRGAAGKSLWRKMRDQQVHRVQVKIPLHPYPFFEDTPSRGLARVPRKLGIQSKATRTW